MTTTNALFIQDNQSTYKLEEENGDVSIFIHVPQFLNNEVSNHYLKLLNDITDWKTGDYKNTDFHRLQRYYNKTGAFFAEGLWKVNHERWRPCEYEDWLTELQTEINDINENAIFNSVLINKYADGTQYIPAHRDISHEECPIIASLSFGATRTFRINHNVHTQLGREYSLASGDLFIMMGSAQTYFTHEILKDSQCQDVRYNMTFR
jgi:alkylated DNA repair dioxygenase AlkB